MADRRGLELLKDLDPAMIERLPLLYSFARPGRECSSREPMVGASTLHRERFRALAPFYKPISKVLAPVRRDGGDE
jgi:hypothetical protein